MQVVTDRQHMRTELSQHEETYYIYVLRWPDGIECFGAAGTPFYVGKGKSFRLFQHERDASTSDSDNDKLEALRKIKQGGKKPIYTIDSWHDTDPSLREAELINQIGRIKDGTGTLTNAQTYAAPAKIDGIEVSKYLHCQKEAGKVTDIPSNFPYKNTRLKKGAVKPKTENTVFGLIYKMLEQNDGITGAELVNMLLSVDWSVCRKTKYTADGMPCAAWICGYIVGGFRSDKQHVGIYKP